MFQLRVSQRQQSASAVFRSGDGHVETAVFLLDGFAAQFMRVISIRDVKDANRFRCKATDGDAFASLRSKLKGILIRREAVLIAEANRVRQRYISRAVF